MITNPELKKRIIEISYEKKLSHLGSCLTAVDIIKEIFDVKKPTEKFILSSGHAGLALYTVIESMGGRNARDIFDHHGVHPDRCVDCGIDCSTGSLGQGLPIAVGMALADRNKNVYCLISDGECSEGSIWEALRIQHELNLTNLRVYLNWNGWGAYKEIKQLLIPTFPIQDGIMKVITPKPSEFPFLKDQSAHYYTMTEEDYKVALKCLT